MNTRGFCCVMIALLVVAACQPAPPPTGAEIAFVANGEDFVRQGFTTKDGWAISFDEVLVNLADITAYQTDPPYDAHSGEDITGTVTQALDAAPQIVDLAAGDENAEPIALGAVGPAPVGHYNALSFAVQPAEEGANSEHSLRLTGAAQKDGEAVQFDISFAEATAYQCGEYVGDVRQGILAEDGSTTLEMTFHFDHIFGDGDLPADDDLNQGAVGFAPFAALAADGTLTITQPELAAALSETDYQLLVEEILPTLAHVGEGHCHAAAME